MLIGLCCLPLAGGLWGCDKDSSPEGEDEFSQYGQQMNVFPSGEEAAAPPSRDESAGAEEGPPRSSDGRDEPLKAMDQEDAPDAPALLPKSRELPGWIKTRPVRTARPGQLAGLLDDPVLAAALESYNLERVSRCTYEWPTVAVDILLIEAGSDLDGLGAFTLLSRHGGQRIKPGEDTLREMQISADQWQMLGWRGKMCVRLSYPATVSEGTMRAVAQVYNRLVYSVPAGPPPTLIRVLPPELLYDAQIWLVRRAAALRATGQERLVEVSASHLDERLGLDGQVALWVIGLPVSIEARARLSSSVATRPAGDAGSSLTALAGVPRADDQNILWLAVYPDIKAAREAYLRYATALGGSTAPVDARTLLSPHQGHWVAGSWTSELESAEPRLPELLKVLGPALVPTPPVPAPPTGDAGGGS